jgi:luciferase family oxidoreductase group 1
MATSVPLSLLDLARVLPTEKAAEGIARSVRLARTADGLGYHRLWVSEHHNMPGLASSATSLYIQHVAAHTRNLRVGAGGIMLPNHSPLVIAEQFGLLETLYPGRIDLGLGRAPGTDGATMAALRRDARASEHFPSDIVELDGYLTGDTRVAGVHAYPHRSAGVPLFILGSSLYGAQLAAHLGLPYAFASHFAPEALVEAARTYRDRFDASRSLAGPDATPHFIAAANVIAADDADVAAEQYRKTELEWLRSILGRGRDLTDAQLVELREHPQGRQVLGMLRRTLVGTGPEVVAGLDALADEVEADELIVVNAAMDEMHQHRTLELLAPGADRRDRDESTFAAAGPVAAV